MNLYDCFFFLASAVQFIGGLLMVSAYLRRIPNNHAYRAFFSAFVRGKTARMYADTATDDASVRPVIAQGIAFVVAGFLIQAITFFVKIM